MNVPFAAGGPMDAVARIVAEGMRAALGQAVIIENVTGADGTIGVGRVARAAPDGYTLSVGQIGTHVLNGAAYSLRYDVVKDFEPISLLSSNPYILVANKALPATNLNELLVWIKANENKASVGVASTTQRLIVAYFQTMTGTRLLEIPYRGAAPALQDVIAGNVAIVFDQPSNSLQQLRAGNTKAFGVTSKKRLFALPNIPSMDEAGLAGFDITGWNALWAPRGTPKDVLATLNAAVVASLANSSVRQRLTDLGQEIPPLEQQTPDALSKFQEAEIKKWWPIMRAANIRGE
jgi:tripartite-type tricarboxylate transporter receptor subunit TctC